LQKIGVQNIRSGILGHTINSSTRDTAKKIEPFSMIWLIFCVPRSLTEECANPKCLERNWTDRWCQIDEPIWQKWGYTQEQEVIEQILAVLLDLLNSVSYEYILYIYSIKLYLFVKVAKSIWREFHYNTTTNQMGHHKRAW